MATKQNSYWRYKHCLYYSLNYLKQIDLGIHGHSHNIFKMSLWKIVKSQNYIFFQKWAPIYHISTMFTSNSCVLRTNGLELRPYFLHHQWYVHSNHSCNYSELPRANNLAQPVRVLWEPQSLGSMFARPHTTFYLFVHSREMIMISKVKYQDGKRVFSNKHTL